MSDPIEELSRLGDALEGAPVPMTAAAARARGDRIRRRRHAAIAAGSAFVVAAVAIPVVALTAGGSGSRDDDLAPQPSVSDPVPRAPLTAENLLTDDDAGAAYGGAGEWRTTHTGPGDGQDLFHPCATTSLARTGADPVFRRSFTLEPAPPSGGWMTAIVGEFADPDRARFVYTQLAAELSECLTGVSGSDYEVVSEEEVGVEVDADARRILATYVADGTRGLVTAMETGLVLAGTRLEVVVSGLGVQSYDTEDPPMETILPRAAARLVLGTAADAGTDAPPAGAERIPDNLPLTSGWPDDGEAEPGGDHGLTGPSRELDDLDLTTACGDPVPDLAYLDRLHARWSNVEDGRARQLTLYATEQEARAAVTMAVEAYQACPTAPERSDGFVTLTDVRPVAAGDEGWAFLESDTLDGAPSTFGETTVVVRTGAAVLVVVHSGHSGNPQGNEDGSVAAVVDQAADVLAAMRDLAD